jgi:hypothetical protein
MRSHHRLTPQTRRLVLLGMASLLLLSGCMLSPLFQAPAVLLTAVSLLLGLAACSAPASSGGGTPATPPPETPADTVIHWPAVVGLSWLSANSSLGLVLLGAATSHEGAGYAVSAGADVNGDGMGDLIIGAPFFSSNTGRAYVVFGGPSLAALAGPTPFDLGTMTSAQGVRLTGPATASAGYAVLLGGDVNGDGHADVVVGGPTASANFGAVWVAFGQGSLLAADQTLPLVAGGAGAPFDGTNGFVLIPNTANNANHTGFSLATGDLNHDGKSDLIVGAPVNSIALHPDHAVIALGTSTWANTFHPESVSAAGAAGRWFVESTSGGSVGSTLATGRVNGDAFDDLVVGAPYAGSAGAVSVIFGVASGDGTSLPANPAAFVPGTGVHITGIGAGTRTTKVGGSLADYSTYSTTNYFLGKKVAVADLNGDGFGDVAVSGYYYSYRRNFHYTGSTPSQSGPAIYDYGDHVFVISGSQLSASGTFSMATQSSQFLTIKLGYKEYVAGLATGIDINGDGHPDLLIGVYSRFNADIAGNTTAGYVIFGGIPLSGTIDVSTLDGTNGFRVQEQGGYRYDHSVTVGDVNGDGIPDVILGSAGSLKDGKVYIIFGRAAGTSYPATPAP